MEETLQTNELERKKSEKLAKKREQQLKDRINVIIFSYSQMMFVIEWLSRSVPNWKFVSWSVTVDWLWVWDAQLQPSPYIDPSGQRLGINFGSDVVAILVFTEVGTGLLYIGVGDSHTLMNKSITFLLEVDTSGPNGCHNVLRCYKLIFFVSV